MKESHKPASRKSKIVVSVLTAALASCGGSGGSESQPVTAAPVTITISSNGVNAAEAETSSSTPTNEAATTAAQTSAPTTEATTPLEPDAYVGEAIPAFVMPDIIAPVVPAGQDFETVSAITSKKQTLRVQGLKVEGGRSLIRTDGVVNLTVSDIEAQDYGPILRARGLGYIAAERIRTTNAGGDAAYGLGIVNVMSGGFTTGTFRDLVFTGNESAPAINDADAWAAITLKGKTANDTGTFTIERFDFRDLWMAPGNNYRNVDGISTERGYSGTIRDGRVVNASDACLDIKGDVTVDNVYLDNCREGLKLWTSQRHGLIEMGTHRFVAIIAIASPERPLSVYINTLILSGDPSVPALRAEDGPVTLTIGTLVASPDQVLNAGNSYAGTTVKVLKRIDL